MRFDPSKPVHGHWTCPIRTMLMWSGQAPSGSNLMPVVPNPMRAGRMYKDIMTPYLQPKMNVHPTTTANPIDHVTRLHTGYWTSNGFCVYVGGGSHPAPASEKCSLYALARSVFDNRYNDYTTVFGGSVVGGGATCIDQVGSLPFY